MLQMNNISLRNVEERKRKEWTEITLENNILADIIRLNSKDTLHKHYTLIKNVSYRRMDQPMWNQCILISSAYIIFNKSQICHGQRK